MKKTIRMNERELHRLISESVKRVLNEVSMKGKSGKTYTLHGTDPDSWLVMADIRNRNPYNYGYNKDIGDMDKHMYSGRRDEDNFIDLSNETDYEDDAKFNNASDIANDITAYIMDKNNGDDMNESIVREAVNRTIRKYIK